MAEKTTPKNRFQCFSTGKNEAGIRSYNCYEQRPSCKGVKETTIKKCAANTFKDVQGVAINGIIKNIATTSFNVDKHSCIEKSLGKNKVVNCTLKK